MTTLFLCGAGNPEGVRLALRVNEQLGRWQRVVILDDDASRHGQSLLGVPIAGGFSLLDAAVREGAEAVNLVARTTQRRARAAERIRASGVAFASLVDPTVETRGAELATGVTVYAGATVSALSAIEEGVVLFAGSNAGHGSHVGRGSVLGPGAVLNARVRAGEGAYVGTNASVLPELVIGEWATIGANSAVIEDVPPGATVMGVPARILSSREDRADGQDGHGSAEPAEGGEPHPADAAVEALVAESFRAVLALPQLDPVENFFDLGGTSLLALRLRVRLEEALCRPVAVTDLYRYPSARAFAAHAAGHRAHDAAAIDGGERGRRRRQFFMRA